jgi:UvrD-like helicase C-terminal domain
LKARAPTTIEGDFDGRKVSYGFGELDELVLAYATTIHKSQGSEYPAVVIPLITQHYPMLRRNLVYTGVTRGKRLVVLIGQRKALAIAVKGARARRRWSKLREWLERYTGNMGAEYRGVIEESSQVEMNPIRALWLPSASDTVVCGYHCRSRGCR